MLVGDAYAHARYAAGTLLLLIAESDPLSFFNQEIYLNQQGKCRLSEEESGHGMSGLPCSANKV
jgi:hypothetical protein